MPQRQCIYPEAHYVPHHRASYDRHGGVVVFVTRRTGLLSALRVQSVYLGLAVIRRGLSASLTRQWAK